MIAHRWREICDARQKGIHDDFLGVADAPFTGLAAAGGALIRGAPGSTLANEQVGDADELFAIQKNQLLLLLLL